MIEQRDSSHRVSIYKPPTVCEQGNVGEKVEFGDFRQDKTKFRIPIYVLQKHGVINSNKQIEY